MMSGERVLIVEDEAAQRERLAKYLRRFEYDVDAVGDAEQALAKLAASSYAVLVTDLRLPGLNGIELIRRARELDEEIGALVVTAYATVETAVEALRVGAHDYLLKPLFFEELERKLRNLVQHRRLIRENERLRSMLQAREETEIIGDSPAMREVLEWVNRAAATTANVLITGETGSGKEVIAQAIHRLGPKRDQPLLSINVAALPETLVESELFGHEKGAFTGAEHRREGMLRAAGTGTVFLDEIGDLGAGVQAKLLRALEAREVLPLGSDRAAPFHARILTATHRDLATRVHSGAFREDLYYRLNVLHIALPPLRERPDDIPALAHHLLRKLAVRNGLTPPVLTTDAIQAMRRYPWPGNIRELSNVLERALIFADDGRIDATRLPPEIRDGGEARGRSLQDAVEIFERNHIAMVLRECEGNRERAAKELSLSPATLYRRIEKLHLKGYGLPRAGRGSGDDPD